jgi:trans-2,3-dihydro-3-hydroxyanthranilate isomerase
VSLRVTIVHACQRAGAGGSPTAVVDETLMSDAERRAVPVAAGTSHVAFVSAEDGATTSLRFFTAEGELPACGHGTVAALAVLASRKRTSAYNAVLRSGGRTFHGEAAGGGNRFQGVFDPGPVDLRVPDEAECTPVLSALGIDVGDALTKCRVASVGRPRLLVPVADRPVLARLAPDMPRLRQACDAAGLLGCYVYTMTSPDGRAAARMFAPSIGVPEDIANANSTACLAAYLADDGIAALNVDMGDALGEPSTVTASVRKGPQGLVVRVGGAATITGEISVL